jgi:hypothetical protein
MTNPLLLAAFSFKFSPDASAPGVHGLTRVVDMAISYGLIAGAVGAVISVAIIAISHGGEYSRLNYAGKIGLASALGAVAILGVISQLLSTAFSLG